MLVAREMRWMGILSFLKYAGLGTRNLLAVRFPLNRLVLKLVVWFVKSGEGCFLIFFLSCFIQTYWTFSP